MESINLINPQGRGEDFTSFLISFDVKKRTVLNAGSGLWEDGCQAWSELSRTASPLCDLREQVTFSESQFPCSRLVNNISSVTPSGDFSTYPSNSYSSSSTLWSAPSASFTKPPVSQEIACFFKPYVVCQPLSLSPLQHLLSIWSLPVALWPWNLPLQYLPWCLAYSHRWFNAYSSHPLENWLWRSF